MTRPRRPRVRQELPPEAIEWLHDGEGGAWVYLTTAEERQALWREHAEQLIDDWIEENPGSRPSRWWELDSPEPRKRVGGVGTARHERFADILCLYCGVPAGWITRSDVRFYRDHLDTDLAVPPLDPNAPPMFESEAAYLKRLRLLLPGEAGRLQAEDFEPETIVDILGLEVAELL